MSVGEEKRGKEAEGNGVGCYPEGHACAGSFVLRLLSLAYLQAGILGEVSGDSFSRIFISFLNVLLGRGGL